MSGSGGVRIGIQADPSAVIASFDRIRSAIRSAGQEGQAFRNVDLSHPELADMADDIQQVRQKFEDLTRIGRGATATAFRSIMAKAGPGADPLDVAKHSEGVFTDPRQQQAFIANVGRYVTQGTQFAPQSSLPPPPEPAPNPLPPRRGGRGAGGEEEEGPGFGATLAGGLMGGLGFMLAAAGLSGVKHVVNKAVAGATDEADGNDTLMRTLGAGSDDFDKLRSSVRDATQGLQLTYGEAQRLSLSWARLTNQSDSAAVLDGVKLSAGLARGYGIDPSETTQVLGRMQYLGDDPKRAAELIADAVQASGQTGQVREVMQALMRFSEATARQSGQTQAGEFASMYAGMSATDNPMLKGAAGEALIGRIDQSVRQGGAFGESSQMLTYRALARNGVNDPYQVDYMLAGGMFGRTGTPGHPDQAGPTLYEAERGEIDRMYGDKNQTGAARYRRLDAIAHQFGINPRQAEALDQFQLGDIGRTHDYLRKQGISLDKVNASGLADIAGVLAPGADLNAYRTRMLDSRRDLSASERSGIEGASGDDLKRQIVQALASHGMEQTDSTRMAEANTSITNALTAAGTGLIPVLIDFKSVMGDLVGVLGGASHALGDAYKDGVHGDQGADKRLASLISGAGGGSPAAGISSAMRSQKAQEALAFFQSKEGGGWSQAQAEGLVANLIQENPDFDPAKIGDNGSAMGLAQWHPDRRAKIEAHFHKSLGSMSVREQEAALNWEITEGQERQGGNILRMAQDPGYAGRVVSRGILRPGATEEAQDAEMAHRGRMAEALHSAGPGGAASGSGSLTASLRVVHERPDGTPISEQHLPMQWQPTTPSGLSSPPTVSGARAG